MSEERNKTYQVKRSKRINTEVANDTFISVQLEQDYDTFDILSLSIGQDDVYRLHNSNYGVIVGRVIANNGFGVPNAKISIFVSADTENDTEEMRSIYGYNNILDTDNKGVRYNLLPDRKVDACHKVVGTFPSKTYILDNDLLMEVFDKYYTLTTRTNESGDYMICGVPCGNNLVHMDVDLSDCGILSQRPRDMVYKGYDINQFESANEFKSSTSLDSLKQILSQNQPVYVNPFWGNDELGETIGITRCDLNLNYKFEPTCVFIGSVIGDNASNGLSKKCVPTNQMGAMDELVTGEGRIEMIRKTPSGEVEAFSVKGTQLIDGNGTWCYQIPMNLDYVMTDEYGNLVPTDDPNKGIPTRTRARFRVSMSDFDGNKDRYLRAKILVPHNPQDISVGTYKKYTKEHLSVQHEDYDYTFGSETRDDSFRDLLWNNVYTVKQFIPRIQYSLNANKSENFTGIKHCNIYGNNNPMPYNNIRIRLPFMFRILCALIKAYVRIVMVINNIIYPITKFLARLSRATLIGNGFTSKFGGAALSMKFVTIADGLCPDLENWYFAPSKRGNLIDSVFSDKDSGGEDGPNANNTLEYDYFSYTYPRLDGEPGTVKLEVRGKAAKFFVCGSNKKLYTSKWPQSYASNLFEYSASEGCRVKTGINKSDVSSTAKIKVTLEGDDDQDFEAYLPYVIFYENEQGEEISRCGDRLDGVSKGEITITIEFSNTKFIYGGEYAFFYDETEYNEAKKVDPTWWDWAQASGLTVDGTTTGHPSVDLYKQTLLYLDAGDEEAKDSKSIDDINKDVDDTTRICITKNTDYLLACIEMNLAQEYKVINFDFYNDWVNGVLYFPRWMMDYRPAQKYLFGAIPVKEKTSGCLANDKDNKFFKFSRKYVEQCSLKYSNTPDSSGMISTIISAPGCSHGPLKTQPQRCHFKRGRDRANIFGKANGGAVKQQKTILGEYVYYYKPCEWKELSDGVDGVRVNLFATDIVLLGSLNDCSLYGIPQAFKDMTSSSYKMPTNLALTNLDEESSVYAMQDGSYCTGKQMFTGDTEGVKEVNATYEKINEYYSTLSDSDNGYEYYGAPEGSYESGFIGLEYHDLHPVTEAAGISWNYSGPGQGKNNPDNLYYPGGHFLGLSCNNSQTNIKTCLNLKRICELGASMSQRHEAIYGYDENSNRVKYRYFIPTGLISNFDITGQSFRSMFASMNMKRLIVDTLDENTGYEKYSFIYMNPNGFNGGMSSLVDKDGDYNKWFGPNDDVIKDMNADIVFIKEAYNIDNRVLNDIEYDFAESANTYAKTIEKMNMYYYMFRFGLTDLSDNKKVLSKFYLQDGKAYESDLDPKYWRGVGVDYVSLPQYANSFYFYFGLKDGSTALDRFKSEFFSECDSTDESYGKNEPYMVLTKNGSDKPRGNSFICNVYNLDGPFTGYIDGKQVNTSTGSTLEFEDIDYGTYEVKVVSRNGNALIATITFSIPEIFASYDVKDISYKIKNVPKYNILEKFRSKQILTDSYLNDCGYVDINKIVEINGENKTLINHTKDSCNVVIVNHETKKFTYLNHGFRMDIFKKNIFGDDYNLYDEITDDKRNNFTKEDEDSIKVYLPKEESEYTIYIGYYDSNTDVYIEYDKFTLRGIDNIDLLVGSKFLSYNNKNSENFSLKDLPINSWWEQLSEMSVQYEKSVWALKHALTNQNALNNGNVVPFDANIFSLNKLGDITNGSVLFGQPENKNGLYSSEDGGLYGNNIFSNSDYNQFYGYSLSDSRVYRGIYNGRAIFGKMTISDGTPASEKINGLIYNDSTVLSGIVTVKFAYTISNIDTLVRIGHGCIINVNGKNFPAIRFNNIIDRQSKSIIAVLKYYGDRELTNDDEISVYPVFYYPTFNKPFTVDITYYTINNSTENRCTIGANGTITNGITYKNKFDTTNFFKSYGIQGLSKALVISDEDAQKEFEAEDRDIKFGFVSDSNITDAIKVAKNDIRDYAFIITEGKPTGTDVDDDLNKPEVLKPFVTSASTDVVMCYDIEINQVDGPNPELEYCKFSELVNSGVKDNGKTSYYAITGYNVNLPFNSSFDFIHNQRINKSNYRRIINEYGTFIDFDTEINIKKADIKLIIGVHEKEENGNTITVFKFYKY